MGKKILVGTAAALVGLLLSCALPGISDVEFAKALIKEAADSTGIYPVQAKTAGPGGITVNLLSVVEDPPGVYNCEFTIAFDHYTPTFAPASIVSGDLTGNLVFDQDSRIVSADIEGSLEVEGEHAGSYRYYATLVIDLNTGEYEYSGEVTIRDTVHDVSK